MFREYGITPEEYNQMYEQQNRECFICGSTHSKRSSKERPLLIDHCHTTGKVRGLLCHPCNAAIGLLQDDPTRFDKAAQYLRASQI